MLDLLNELIAVADKDFDGHLTIMKFTDNWRVGFGTPHGRHDIDDMAAGKSFEEAARSALAQVGGPQLECQLILPDHHASYGGDRESSTASQQRFILVCADLDDASTSDSRRF